MLASHDTMGMDPSTALILFEKKNTIETYFYVIIKNSVFLCFV